MNTTSVLLYFQVHQPYRLRRYSFFDIGNDRRYFDDAANEAIVRRVARKCYLPMNQLLLDEIERSCRTFRCAFSISGTALSQFERWTPEVLDSFRALADTGCVEFLAETSHHSLAFLGDPAEFRAQVADQRGRVEALFGVRPRTFRNTELVLHDSVAKAAEDLGFDAILAEGADHLLGWRDPWQPYRPAGCDRIALLLRSYKLSDDIAFRFSDQGWAEWPLSAEKFAGWMAEVPEHARCVGLFMDYETAGEHQWEESGIFDFMRTMPGAVASNPRFRFATPSDVAEDHVAEDVISAAGPVSWADAERDLSAWLGNDMQRAAHEALYAALPAVKKAARAGDRTILEDWRRLSTSDHVYYMCTKWASDGDVHAYFSPWDTPHDAFITFMNVVDDLVRRAAATKPKRRRKSKPGAARRKAAVAVPTRLPGGTA